MSRSGRSPGEGNGILYSCLGNPTDRGAWWAIGCKRVGHDLATKTNQTSFSITSAPLGFKLKLIATLNWQLRWEGVGVGEGGSQKQKI